MEVFIGEHLTEIKKLAQETVRRAGSSDTVTAELTRDEFPEKTYGTLTFPEGEYEALRIRMVAGKSQLVVLPVSGALLYGCGACGSG